MIILRDNEDARIDAMRTRVDAVSPVSTQADDPGEDLQTVGGVAIPELPDPAVGGRNGSRMRNGFNTGFRSFASRFQPFRGAVAALPIITNPIQGNVGTGNRSATLYAGVMNQLVTYSPDSTALAKDITGIR